MKRNRQSSKSQQTIQVWTLEQARSLVPYRVNPSALVGAGGIPTAGGSAYTYGSWAELYDAVTETDFAVIMGWSGNAKDTGTGVDAQVGFGYGGAGSEVTWGEFPIQNSPGQICVFDLPIPVIIPGSTRLATKYASATASQICEYPVHRQMFPAR